MDSINIFELNSQEQQAYLERLVDFHKEECYKEITKEISERIDFELGEIAKQGMALEFLVAKEINDILHNNNARYPHCIGTATGSIVAYILSITDVEFEPISHGLIFERGFSAQSKGGSHFDFFVKEYEKQGLLSELSARYTNVSVSPEYIDELLTVNGVSVVLQNRLVVYDLGDILRASKIAFFQEDYMHFLHFVAGYSYEEANSIRVLCAKMKKVELRTYKLDFVSRCKDRFDKEKAEELFDSIMVEFRYARTKAYVLSSKSIIRRIEDKLYDNKLIILGNFGQWYEKEILPLLSNKSFVALINELFDLCYLQHLNQNLSAEQQDKCVWRCYLNNNCLIDTLLKMAYEIFTVGIVKNPGEKLLLLDLGGPYYKPILGYLLAKKYIE